MTLNVHHHVISNCTPVPPVPPRDPRVEEFKDTIHDILTSIKKMSDKEKKKDVCYVFFDYLVEEKDFWQNHKKLKKFLPLVHTRLLVLQKQGFHSNKYLIKLGYSCGYPIEKYKGKICLKKPYNNGFCKFHEKFEKKRREYIKESLPLILDLQNIVMNF